MRGSAGADVIEILSSDDDVAEGAERVGLQRLPPQKRRRLAVDHVDLTDPTVAAIYLPAHNHPSTSKNVGKSVDRSRADYHVAASSTRSPAKASSLSCPVCLDTLRQPTSTHCGHLFCFDCISAAVKSQKKCPTCRKKLTMRAVHRIYLP